MDMSRFARWAPLTGVLFFVLAVAGVLLAGPDSPSFPDDPQKYLSYYSDDSGRVILGSWLSCLGAFSLLWFLGSLSTWLHAVEPGSSRLARIAHGGGVAGSALLIAGFIANMIPAFRVDQDKALSADVAVSLGDLSTGLVFVAAPFALAAMLGATAVAALRTAALPAWWCWVTAVIAIALLVIWISFLALALFTIWVLVMAVLLYRRQAAVVPAAA